MKSSSPRKLVVLGSGFAAFRLLRDIDTRKFDVVGISPRNHFLFTPLLPSTTVGTVEFRSIIESVRQACPKVRFFSAEALGVDSSAKKLSCRGIVDGRTFDLDYDILVIAVGSTNSTFGIPGVAENAYFLKQLSDARALRQRIIECFEMASQPGLSEEERHGMLSFVVIGGGATGVEFSAEMHDFLTEDLRKAYPDRIDEVRIILLEASKQILSTFDAALSDYTLKHFQRQKIQVRTESLVVGIDPKYIHLKDKSHIAYGLVVWAAGVAPVEFVKNLPFEKEKGRLITDEYLRLSGQDSIYALGDCATLRDQDLPMTAQVAEQGGKYLARSLARHESGKNIKPFHYKHAGMLAYVGSNRALADLNKIKGKGFATFLFWRSAYLTKLVSRRNKVLVLFDWLKNFLFGRDVSRM